MLRRLGPETVDDLLIAERAERRHGEHLRLTAREKRRAVRTRQQPDLAGDGAHLLEPAPIGTDLLPRDHAAHDGLLEVVERHRDLLLHLRILRQELLHHIGGDGRDMRVAIELVRVPHRLIEERPRGGVERLCERLRHLEEPRLAFQLAAGRLDLLLERHDALDLLVSEQDGIEHDLLGQLRRPGLDHHDRVGRACHREIER